MGNQPLRSYVVTSWNTSRALSLKQVHPPGRALLWEASRLVVCGWEDVTVAERQKAVKP